MFTTSKVDLSLDLESLARNLDHSDLQHVFAQDNSDNEDKDLYV